MFIPQLDELDAFDSRGNQVDDINSLTEYIDQVVLGNYDDTPEDEDDDNAFYLNVIKMDQYCFQQSIIEVSTPFQSLPDKVNYPSQIESKLSCTFFDVQSPPPEV